MENKIFKGVVEYNPYTGKFVWAKPTSNRVRAGAEIGNKNDRYEYVNVMGIRYMLHNIAIELMTGKHVPAGFVVDHINQDTHDNRIANLRVIKEKEFGYHKNHGINLSKNDYRSR